jgi:flagellin-like protein
MKGVSEIIAIILILMIVIALAALAYTWFSGIFASMTTTAGTNIQNTANTMNIQFVIDAASCNTGPCAVGSTVSITVRNTGQPHFNASQTSFYIDGKPFAFTAAQCTAGTCIATDLANGCTYTCSRVTVAADPLPRCPSVTPAQTSLMKAVIASGLEQSDTVNC